MLTRQTIALAALICAVSTGHTAPADKPDNSKILGTYECRTGSSAVVTVDRPPETQQYNPEEPALRIAVSSLDEKARAELLRWDVKDKAWHESRRGIKLWVRQVEFKDAYWAVMFDGAFAGLVGSAMLTNLPGATRAAIPPDKPVFVLTQFTSFFANAGIFACDKL